MGKKKFVSRSSFLRKKVVKISIFILLLMGIGYSTFNSSLFMNATVEVAKLKVTVNSGEYLEHGTKTGADCPAGSFCPGNTFSYDAVNDQGLISCAVGSYSAAKSGSCTACQGKTTSQVGSTSCDTDCSNNTGVSTWETTTWNSNNSITNLCVINSCSGGYTKDGNSCIANNYTVTLDNQNATTAGSTSVTATYNADIPTITPPTKRGYNFQGYVNVIEHEDPEPDEEILYIKSDGTSNKKWDITSDKTLVAKWEAISITCSAGEYLAGDATSCSSCPEGYSCSGGDYNFNPTEPQGANICSAGTYSTGGATTCTACTGGVTNTPGANSCSTTCSNAAHVASWVSSCTISTCDTGYENVSNTCTARHFNITLNNKNATTPGSTTVEVTYNSPVPNITVPEKNGYTFGGYYTEENGAGTQYIQADGSSAHNWNKTNVDTLYAKWTVITRNCSAGQYLPQGSTTCASCPAGSFCEGGNYSYKAGEDQGITACAVGSYSGASASSCTACTGLTTSGTGKTSCDTQCDNNSNVSTWNNGTWNSNNPLGICSIATCTVGYSKENNTCTPNELDFSNQTINSDYSTEAADKNVTAPTTGTGTYTYSKKSGESDITVSSAGVITIPASKAAGTYTVVITVTDSNSNVSKDATYTINVQKVNAVLTCSNKTYDGTEQTACTCTGGIVGGDYKGTNAGDYTASCTGDSNHNNPTNETWTMSKKEVAPVTDLTISNVGVVSWTNSVGATSYQISVDNANWTAVPAGTTTTSYNYLNNIVGSSGERTVYVKSINSDTTNYTNSNSVNASTTVYTVTFNRNNNDYGTVSPATINVITGETYSSSGNVITLQDGRTVTATPATVSGYNITFDSWSSESGTISTTTTITANFTSAISNYNITYDANGGEFGDTTTTNNVEYSVFTNGTDKTLVVDTGTYEEPTKTDKVFDGWNTERDGSGTSISSEAQITNFTIVTATLYAQYRDPRATFTTGKQFNAAIKQASGSSGATYSTENSNITAFEKYTGTVTQQLLNDAVIVSDASSERDIYAWFDNGTIYWYTTSDTIYFNSNSSYMFNCLTNLTEVDLSEFDLSKVSSSSSMFSNMTNFNTLITPKVNASTSISIGKTMWNQSNTTYSSLTSSTPTETTLKVPYTITYDLNGGMSYTCDIVRTQQIYPGNSLGTTPNISASKFGYAQGAWCLDSECNTVVNLTEETIPPSTITYYIQWTRSGVWADDVEYSHSGINCNDTQCLLDYLGNNYVEKRVSINGN